MQTKIFLDSGDPAETKKAIALLGRLDGQTTNPTLITKHPEAQRRFAAGEKFTSDEILRFYKDIVQEISVLIPDGSVSIEVYADAYTSDDDMVAQAKDMWTWIPNAHMKFPTTAAGLSAAEQCIALGMRVNMTLCFSEQQAAAIYAATQGAAAGDVFVSPFIGRLDDIGEHGIDLIANIVRLYSERGDGHVQVLAASTRNAEHVAAAIGAGADIITMPFGVLDEWVEAGKPLKGMDSKSSELVPILYTDIALDSAWEDYNIDHPLTEKGVERFASDWNEIITEEVAQKENSAS